MAPRVEPVASRAGERRGYTANQALHLKSRCEIHRVFFLGTVFGGGEEALCWRWTPRRARRRGAGRGLLPLPWRAVWTV